MRFSLPIYHLHRDTWKVARLASSSVFVASSYQLIISLTMTTKQPVPNSLRFYRKQAGLRQVDVAAKLGFTSYDRISHWEKGSAFPSVTNLFRLSALYKVPAQELYEEYRATLERQLILMPSGQAQQTIEIPTISKLL